MKEKSVVVYPNMLVMLFIGLSFIVPGDTIRAFWILFIVFIIGAFRKNTIRLSEVFGIGILRWIYVITVVSSFIIHYYSATIRNIFNFVIIFFLGRYMIISEIRSRRNFDLFLNMILLIFFFYTILGLFETFTQFNLFDYITKREIVMGGANSIRNGFFRSHGFCAVSFNNGVIMSMIWCLAAYKLFNKLNIWNLILYILFGLYTFLIFSRMVILVSLFSQFLLFISNKKISKLKISVAVIGILCIFFLLPGERTVLEGYLSSFIPLLEEIRNFSIYSSGIHSGGTGERFALLGWVYNSIRDQIFFGAGFLKPFSYHYWFVDRYYLKESIENQWLWSLYRTGLYGLFGFIIYQFYCMKNTHIVSLSKRMKKKNGKYKVLQTEKLTFYSCFRIIVIGYFLSIFAVASFEDLIVFYFLYALYEAYNKVTVEEGVIYE